MLTREERIFRAPIDHSPAADEAGWRGRGRWMILDRAGRLAAPNGRWPDAAAGEVAVVRTGKRRAGRLLDGRTHHEVPR